MNFQNKIKKKVSISCHNEAPYGHDILAQLSAIALMHDNILFERVIDTRDCFIITQYD
jgi:hypothetical protein